ncbi:hypothetical protein ACQ4PT_001653 [Festuca glaucescens]
MVGSCVVQEMVSRAISRVLSAPEDKAASAMERLEMAHSGLELALERSGKLPITDVSLLRQRRMFKRAHEECGHVLYKHKLRVIQDDDEETKKGVTPSSFPASYTRKIIHTVKSYFLGPAMDESSCADTSVGRFEWFADKAAKFVRDVETGCSLAHYRFLNPLITQLLEGKILKYETAQGSRRCQIFIEPVHLEEHGVVASLWFRSQDSGTPTRGFKLVLMLRLSESTDIVGVATRCLSLLGPKFRSSAQFVTGELAQMPAQDVFHHRSSPVVAAGVPVKLSISAGLYRPDPVCCRRSRPHSAAASESSHGFLEQVILMSFNCYVPASAAGGVVTDWPPLELTVFFTPHCFREDDTGSSYLLKTVGGQEEGMCYSLRQTWEMARAKAVDFFICQPETAEYEMLWESLHGFATLIFQRHIYCAQEQEESSKDKALES